VQSKKIKDLVLEMDREVEAIIGIGEQETSLGEETPDDEAP